jgi:hypothetical protein
MLASDAGTSSLPNSSWMTCMTLVPRFSGTQCHNGLEGIGNGFISKYTSSPFLSFCDRGHAVRETTPHPPPSPILVPLSSIQPRPRLAKAATCTVHASNEQNGSIFSQPISCSWRSKYLCHSRLRMSRVASKAPSPVAYSQVIFLSAV